MSNQKTVEEPIGFDEKPNQNASPASVLDRLSEVLLADDARGYLIRLFTEPWPILGVWSIGDLLGFMTGWRDYRLGQSVKGGLKIITAVIPGVPTIPLHFLIDKLYAQKNLPKNNITAQT